MRIVAGIVGTLVSAALAAGAAAPGAASGDDATQAVYWLRLAAQTDAVAPAKLRAQLLCEIAELQQGAGDAAGFQKTLEKAQRSAQSIGDRAARARAWGDIAAAWARGAIGGVRGHRRRPGPRGANGPGQGHRADATSTR